MLRAEDSRAPAAKTILLQPLILTASGRPKLLAGEAELASLHKADLQFQEQGGVPGCIAKRHEDGVASLTAFRLLWVDASRAPSPGASCQVHFSCIESIELSATKRWAHTKLRITFHADQHGQPVSGQNSYTQLEEIRLVSRHYGTFPDLARSVLYQRGWEHQTGGSSMQNPLAAAYLLQTNPGQGFPSPSGDQISSHAFASQAHLQDISPDAGLVQQLTNMGFSKARVFRACIATQNSGPQEALQWLIEHEKDPAADLPLQSTPALKARQMQSNPVVGIAGILKREEEIAARNDRVLDEAFQDLRALMTKAQEMVQLAEKFRETLASKGGDSESLDPEMQRQLIDMGIASPVTKDTAGAQYHQQLSRQLAEFLDPQLRKVGGIVTLADVYCLFNRARGTELISPDDLLQAVNLFPAAGAPMHLRTFPTGVLVVQSNSHDDNEVCARVAEMVTGEGCGPAITAAEVADVFSVPITIAAQHLATAESKAVLCRDDGPEGLRFFRNFFEEITVNQTVM